MQWNIIYQNWVTLLIPCGETISSGAVMVFISCYIQEIRNGELWVGTDQGLYRLEQGKWIQHMSAAANCLAELPDGTLLVGGNDGLKVKPPAEEALAVLTYLQGNFISRLFLYSDGLIWCYSTAGIFSYDGVTWKNHTPRFRIPRVRDYHWTSNIFEDSKRRKVAISIFQ